MITIAAIKTILENSSPEILPDDGSVRGAVIVPIFEKDGQLYMLFTKRTEALSTHKGQISFPGGKIDDQDSSLFNCAIRETFEEIGLDPTKITLLGTLDQIKTTGSNVLLSPFVCKIDFPFTLKINEKEVQEVITVPFEELLNNDNWDCKKVMMAEIKEKHIWYFFYQNWTIWGATGRITKHFLRLIQ
ncbi:MAG: NUDIX hydrolase [Candidatus Heimdallarchaeota archaeon]